MVMVGKSIIAASSVRCPKNKPPVWSPVFTCRSPGRWLEDIVPVKSTADFPSTLNPKPYIIPSRDFTHILLHQILLDLYCFSCNLQHFYHERIQILSELRLSAKKRQTRRGNRKRRVEESEILLHVLRQRGIFNAAGRRYRRENAGFLHTGNEKGWHERYLCLVGHPGHTQP